MQRRVAFPNILAVGGDGLGVDFKGLSYQTGEESLAA